MYKRIIKKFIKVLESLIKDKKASPEPIIDESSGLTREQLVSQLDGIPLEKGSIVFIHSGYKSIGAVRGGPQTVVEALRESLVESRDITVAMPSFTIFGNVQQQLKSKTVFDVRSSPTVFKDIPLTFQKLPNIKRSIHPTHSIIALGPKAQWLVKEHHTCGSIFGKDSPFGKLLDHKSYIMGMGSRLGTVTFYHAIEDIEPDFPFPVYTDDSPYKVTCIDHDGNKVKMNVSAHDSKVSRVRIDNPKTGAFLRDIYTRVFENVAGLDYYSVGKAKTWLIDAQRMYETQKQLTYSGISIYATEQSIGDFISKCLFAKVNDG